MRNEERPGSGSGEVIERIAALETRVPAAGCCAGSWGDAPDGAYLDAAPSTGPGRDRQARGGHPLMFFYPRKMTGRPACMRQDRSALEAKSCLARSGSKSMPSNRRAHGAHRARSQRAALPKAALKNCCKITAEESHKTQSKGETRCHR